MPAVLRNPATPKPAATPPAAQDRQTQAESPDDGEIANPPAIPDWGLSRKKPRWGLKYRIGAAALVLFGAAGGYAAYTYFFATIPAGDGSLQDSPVVARSDDRDAEPGADSPGTGDPFDDIVPKVGPVTNSRTSPAKEPRRIGTSLDATPIGRSVSASDRTRKNPLRESLALDDDEIPEMADDFDGREKGSIDRDLDDGGSGTLDKAPANSLRQRSADTRNDLRQSRPNVQQKKSKGGPRLSTFDEDNEAADDRSDEKLDGYRVAGNRNSGGSRRTGGDPSISIVEAKDDLEPDERFDGFEPQDVTTRRAVSKTLVVREAESGSPTAGDFGSGNMSGRRDPASRATNLRDDDEFEPASRTAGRDADESFARPARGEFHAIQQRSSPPAPAADRRFTSSLPAGRHSPSAGPVSDTYRVAPDDNFWKISKKQYGTARYYQALMRCNQERVPDPQKLRPGTQILTPPAAVLEQRFPELIEKPAPGGPATSEATDRSAMRPSFEKPLVSDDADEPVSRAKGDAGAGGYFYGKSGEPLYRIGPDDTLTSIAQKHLGRASRWNEIYEKNQDVLPSPDNLTLGTVIRLPTDASRVGLAPDGDRRR